jgi:hypothetical protein
MYVTVSLHCFEKSKNIYIYETKEILMRIKRNQKKLLLYYIILYYIVFLLKMYL